MNPAYLPPQQSNYNQSTNGFPTRSNNSNVPLTNQQKNGPTPLNAPSSGLIGAPNTINGPPPSMPSNNTSVGYPPNMLQKNSQPFGSGNGSQQQPYLPTNSEFPGPNPQLRPGPQIMPQKPPSVPPNQYPPGMPPSVLQNQSLGPPSLNPMPPMQGSMSPKQPPGSSQNPAAMMPSQPGLVQNQSPLMPPQTGLVQNQTPLLPPQPGSFQNQSPLMPPQQAPVLNKSPLMPPNSRPIQSQSPLMPPHPGSVQTQSPLMPPHSGPVQTQPSLMPPHPGSVQTQPPLMPPQGRPPHLGQVNPMQQPQLNPMPMMQQPSTNHLPPGPAQGQMPPLANRMPPLPGQQMNQPNQLTNQMQNMSLGGARPAPHMPPSLNDPNYMQQQPRPGYPPMSQPGGGYTQPQQQQQPKRLDPDQMPSPIQVVQDDQCNRSGIFVTNQKGLVPPLVTTDFVVQDQGNTSPRYIRSTMYNVPVSQDIMKHTAVPFSLVISPMARLGKDEYPPPIVNFGELGPVRCIRCKAYMCPYMQFIDSGRRFQCLFCKATTDVPAEYFQHLDHTGQRMDKYERPELVLGTYELVATADYCRNNTLPKPPAVIFVIDVSYNNIKSGLVSLLCSRMREIIENLPVDQGHEKSNMKVGFITYNSSVHFYNIKGTLASPQMMVVGDTQEMFMPLLDGFLCTPEESGAVIDALMEQIPAMFSDTKETEIVLLPAILAGLEALKASETTGKLMVFHSTLPIAEAPGKLRNRDDRKLLGTDKEKTVLTPQTQAYNQLGQDCVAAGCSVDLFIFNNSYIDIATISQVSRLTGGELYKYTYFQADIDGERLINDVILDISRPIAFDGIMRVRTSTGVRPTDFYGYFYMSNTTDMEFAAVDADKGVAIEIKHDDKLSEEDGVYIQVALLYTACSGQRRLRIMNLALKSCSQMADLYRSCDLDTLINFFSKQVTYKLMDQSPKSIKEALVNRAAQILATYRKNCASPSSAGQLILPECMKLLPLYINCLLKSDAISGGSDMTLDDRAFAMQAVLTMDVSSSVNHFYPQLIPIHEIDPSSDPLEIPAPIRCTIEKMSEQGVYILENGIHMFLWIGLGASPDFIQNVFGAPSAVQVDIERPFLPELDNPLSIAVRKLIDDLRVTRHRFMRLTIVRQREKLEPVFKHFLVEDRGTDGSASYVDFLCHMHKEIRGMLS